MTDRFTQHTLSDFVDGLDKMSPEERREGIIGLLNKTATAAGVNTMAMLWAVVRANGGQVVVPHEIVAQFDPERVIFGRSETEEGIEYTAGLK